MLGKLTPAQEEEVERYAEQYPEIREELNAIERALEEYALLYGRTPPPGTLSAILERIGEEAGSRAGQQGRPPSLALPGILALLLLIGLGGWFFSYQNNQELQQELEQQQAQYDSLQEGCDSLQAEQQQLQERLRFLQQPGTRNIIMSGTDLSPEAVASVFFNPGEQTALLSSAQLPPVPADKQYQLWAIVGDQPVSMGVFDPSQDEAVLDEVSYVEGAQAFAVTLEPRGGSEQPTLEQMYVIGNI